jgi:hypothetical protein
VNFLVFCALLHCVSWFSSCCRTLNFPLPAAAQFRTGNPAECGEKTPQEPVQTAQKLFSAQSTAIPRDVVHLHRFRPYPEFPINRRSQLAAPIQPLRPGTISVELCEIAFLPPRAQKPG